MTWLETRERERERTMKKIEWRLYMAPVLHQDRFFYPGWLCYPSRPITTMIFTRERFTKTLLKKKREKCVSGIHYLSRELLITVIVLLIWTYLVCMKNPSLISPAAWRPTWTSKSQRDREGVLVWLCLLFKLCFARIAWIIYRRT